MKKRIYSLLATLCLLLTFTGCAGVMQSVQDFGKKMVVPPFPQWRKHHWEDKELWGNRGNFLQGYAVRKVPIAIEQVSPFEVGLIEEEIVIMEEKMPRPKRKDLPTTYTVKKGDCLWFIAGYPEIYGNPLLWPKIYEANRDKIKDPDLIYPDQVFIIPREGEKREEKEKIEYEKYEKYEK